MNHYEILGVGPDATDQQIKEGYRREAMKWHPDRHEGAAAKGEADRRFKELALAYRTLRDAVARAEYDRELEQKLRGEYDARQQEQFRQERAQKEQAQRQQAKRDKPSQNYSESGSRSEEQTATDDANQMFFEQMLDLAFELAGQGFPEANIFKALIALGCPESMAKAVASIAAKRGKVNENKSSQSAQAAVQPDTPALADFDSATWEEIEPYYSAAVMGTSRTSSLSAQQFDAVSAVRKSRDDLWLGLGTVVLVLGVLVGIFGKFKAFEVAGIVAPMELIFLLLAILSRSLFLGPDSASFFRENIKRYYMDNFKAFHKEKRQSFPAVNGFNWSAALFNVSWLGYRRNLWPAFLFVLVYCGIGIALTVVDAGAYSSGIVFANLVVSAVIGFYGNRLYFNKIESRIRVATRNATPKQAIAALHKRGGTNSVGWVLPVLVFFVFSIPIYAIEKERENDRILAIEKANAAVLAAQQLAEENRTRLAAEKAQKNVLDGYNAYVTQVERQYPFLNPDSPQHNQQSADWVVQRMNAYQAQGQVPERALRSAISDMVTIIAQRSNAENQSGTRPAPVTMAAPKTSTSPRPMNPPPNDVLCQTWPSACR